jgi:peptidoglycan/LPS O-acetylase OafA/YrhL
VTKSNTDALTGIRFFAAAAIVLHHSQDNYYFHQGIFNALTLDRAVQLFFALSGFVLAINAGKYLSFWDFFVARFARVWPAHLFGLLICVWMLFPGGLRYLAEPTQLGALAVNLGLLQAWSPDMKVFFGYNAPSWSVSCEMFFYLTFLPMFWFLTKSPWLRAPLLAAGLGAALWVGDLLAARFGFTGVVWLQYINPLVNLPIFAMGVFTGVVFTRVKVGNIPFGVASLIQFVALVLVLVSNHLPLLMGRFESDFKACVACCALFFVLSSTDGAVSRALSIRPLIYLGEISYSIYMIHDTILVAGAEGRLMPALPIWVQWGIELVIIGALAAVSHAIVERPMRHMIVKGWKALRRPVVAPV